MVDTSGNKRFVRFRELSASERFCLFSEKMEKTLKNIYYLNTRKAFLGFSRRHAINGMNFGVAGGGNNGMNFG